MRAKATMRRPTRSSMRSPAIASISGSPVSPWHGGPGPKWGWPPGCRRRMWPACVVRGRRPFRPTKGLRFWMMRSIDLRPDAFRVEHTTLEWSPARLAIVWQEDFLLHLRALYQGFYQGDDAGFRAALKDLRLLSVETLFRQHFGDGDQTEVVFSTRHFMKTFTEIFEASARSKISLHRNFVALGFYLASLYQSLEGLGGPFDVRAAFFASGGETFAR